MHRARIALGAFLRREGLYSSHLCTWVMGSIVYPSDALRQGIEGDVLLEFTVQPTGEISDAVVLTCSPPAVPA